MFKNLTYFNSFFSGNRKQLETLFDFDVSKSNYLINISHKYRYIYIETPKVACSTIKKTLYTLELNDSKKLPSDIHNKKESPLLSPLDVMKPLDFYFEEYFSFAFVRNPYTRILSCYLDKVIENKEERLVRLPKLGLDPTDEISFETFLLAVKKYPLVDIHWMSQSLLLSSNKIKLDFIGKQESFDSDFAQVLSKIKNNENIINERPHSVSANSKLSKYLNEKIISLIQEIYYDDFINFGYDLDPFK